MIEAVKQSKYDTTNPPTRNRVPIRLGMQEPMQARPRRDDFMCRRFLVAKLTAHLRRFDREN